MPAIVKSASLSFFGKSSGGCSDGGVSDNWSTRVVSNGGAAPSAATKSAICTFVSGAKSDGFWTKIVSANVFAPDNLTACITPLVVGPGKDPWTNSGGTFQPGDVTVNGLAGDHASRLLLTGIFPATAFSSQTTAGWAFYDYLVQSNGFVLGSYAASGSPAFMGAGKFSDNNAYSYNGQSVNNSVTVASSGNGYYASVRVSSTDHRLFFAKSTTAHAQIGATDTLSSTGSLPNIECYVFGEQFGNVPQFLCSDTISFVAFFVGFTATDSANLFNRIQALRTAFGGGFR